MQQRSGFTPPPQMGNAGPGPGTIIRPNQPYTSMRQGPMPTPPVGKRSADRSTHTNVTAKTVSATTLHAFSFNFTFAFSLLHVLIY